jgi:prepilin-type N-terminal cleavage/methylation domain-containing protein
MLSKLRNATISRDKKINKETGRAPYGERSDAFTLVEVIIAMAIIAIAGVMCVSAFMTIIRLETRETNTRFASENVEGRIAGGGGETTSAASIIKLGGFDITATVDSYSDTVGSADANRPDGDTGDVGMGDVGTSGSRNYTVLRDSGEPSQTPLPIFFGDGADAFQAKGHAEPTGSDGSKMEVTITTTGRYSVEVWGACGGGEDLSGTKGANYAGGGKGGYAFGEVNLNKGDKLYLYAGGVGVRYQLDPGKIGRRSGGSNGGGDVYTSHGTSGGGASDVRVNSDDLYSRIIVAGGGGGGGYSTSLDTVGVMSGGNAGGEWADHASSYEIYQKNGNTYVRGQGGTQSEGGTYNTSDGQYNPPYYNNVATEGKFGAGELGVGSNIGGGGGGGGWYGGSGGAVNGGGGGSSWIYTVKTLNNWKSKNNNDAKNYKLGSEYMLKNAKLLPDGNTLERIPDPLDTNFDPDNPARAGNTITGNNRGGFVRVIYLGESL